MMAKNKTRDLAVAMATIARTLPGQFHRLEEALEEQPVEVQLDFCRLVREFDQRLTDAKRKAREPWRR
jgi:hypothetical protein